ncbi:hypothetical protein LSAT2_020397 [Lamellibrachia satsuma]|nr:hypothetical protein LSAT2_020397 [Lamellibrachia satsuma]
MLSKNDYVPGAISEALRATSDSRGQGHSPPKKTAADKSLQKLFSKPMKPVPVRIQQTEKTKEVGLVDDEKTMKKKKKKKKRKLDEDDNKEATSTAIEGQSPKTKKQKHSSDQSDTEMPKTPTPDPEKESRTVFIGNLPNTLTKKGVKALFIKFGAIESVRFRCAAPANPKLPKKAVVIKKEFHADRHNINAYIVFKEKSSAEAAISLNGHEIEGLHIRVDLAQKNKEHDHSRSIFVGNMPFDTEEDQMREQFAVCGDIENVRIVRDKKFRLGKGFGYVLFKESDSVGLALKLDGATFRKRKLRVERSTNNPQKPMAIAPKKGKKMKMERKTDKDDRPIERRKKKSKKNSGATRNSFMGDVSSNKKVDRRKQRMNRKKKSSSGMRRAPSTGKVFARNRLAKKMKKSSV